jgi:hypothetical protein
MVEPKLAALIEVTGRFSGLFPPLAVPNGFPALDPTLLYPVGGGYC